MHATHATTHGDTGIKLGVGAWELVDVFHVEDLSAGAHFGGADVEAGTQALNLEAVLLAVDGEDALPGASAQEEAHLLLFKGYGADWLLVIRQG